LSFLGLLSLQVLHGKSGDCAILFKPFSGTTPSRKPLPKRKNTWNFLKCAYMVITYLFVSYNKGDW
uniref:Uncharacterized protein n=1 Tax=Chlorocebus sabaeus TaxID=60711 RepID=A0A0D9S665_CHLSB